MKRITLLLFLVGSVLNDPLSVVVKYGGSVILPCKGNSMAVPFKLIHFRWDTDKDDPVLEFFSEVVYPGAGFETAAEISRELIGQGDFSLTVHNVTFAQEHIYECRYIDLDHTRKFLGEVRLSVTGHEENVTVTDGHPLNIPLYTRETVKVQFAPEGSGVSVLVCAVEKSSVTPVQLYKPRVSIQDKTLQLSGVSFSDQGSYTVLDLRADRIISTVKVHVEDSDSTWLAPVIVGIVILAVLVASGIIFGLVRHLRSGQRLGTPGPDVELLGNGAAGNRPDDPGPADPLGHGK
ncbi:uncharacterized protein [Lepisosteus oculatus]|uniref:uncharacterized protein isoform X2 n=1 Tax=Lepisosteus oculatus TaxID=7918 RepID=UPI0035F52478